MKVPHDAQRFLALQSGEHVKYAQLDTYIENNVTDLASARAYLKKLSKVVLAMLKKMD